MPIHDSFATIVQLETMLHRADARHDTMILKSVLHPSFREFGRSGRAYDRAEIVNALVSEVATPSTWAQDFHAQQIDTRTVLLTYRSALLGEDDGLERYTNRSSIWLETSTGWQMVFHQGTPTDPFPRAKPNSRFDTDAYGAGQPGR